MELDAPNWLETIREFRQAVEAHARMEEEQVFPRLRSEIDEDLDARITKEVNKAGFMMAYNQREPRRILCAEFDGAIAEDARDGRRGRRRVCNRADDQDRFLVFADRQNGANCTVASLGVGKLATNQGNPTLGR